MPTGYSKTPEETRKKQSEYRKAHPIRFWLGKKRPEFSEFFKGHKVSEETSRKIVATRRERDNYKINEETRQKMSLAKKGKPGNNKGKHWKVKDATKMAKPKGEKSWGWKGGLSPMYNNMSLDKKEAIAGRKKPEQCEICGAFGSSLKKGIHFDHDHKTGKFRGWICSRCNLALGLVKDNTETLSAMIEYLNKNKTNQ